MSRSIRSLRRHPAAVALLALPLAAMLLVSACGPKADPESGTGQDGGSTGTGGTGGSSDGHACSSDANCAAAEGGHACVLDGMMCGCTTDAHCKGISSGARCTAGLYACTCESAADCLDPKAQGCKVNGDGYAQCGRCAEASECHLAAAGDACDASTGACKPCTSDAECMAGILCDTSTGRCSKCASDYDCEGSQYGSHCDTAKGACTQL